jgi:hypothetical protein
LVTIPQLNIGTPPENAIPAGPCKVTFVWPNILGPTPNPTVIFYDSVIENGDYEGTIKGLREQGGAYFTNVDGQFAFLPWPPLGIRIEPIAK